ncbi:hypothetical protein [Haloferula sp.]|uniref:hypothetical protein n=1 Tax=Haloferula sp. TaxID=2497595 RepID=UPI00329C6B27
MNPVPGPEPNPQEQLELRPNPAIGIFRFFTWLMPTAIGIGCLFLGAWLPDTIPSPLPWTHLMWALAIAGLIGCGLIDSKLALPCRIGKRTCGLHTLIFSLTQVFFVIPALIVGTLYAICASNPW